MSTDDFFRTLTDDELRKVLPWVDHAKKRYGRALVAAGWNRHDLFGFTGNPEKLIHICGVFGMLMAGWIIDEIHADHVVLRHQNRTDPVIKIKGSVLVGPAEWIRCQEYQ